MYVVVIVESCCNHFISVDSVHDFTWQADDRASDVNAQFGVDGDLHASVVKAKEEYSG